MHRRHFIGTSLAASLALFGGTGRAQAPARPRSRRCQSAKRVTVAFMIGHHANVIDTAGPWEVFQDASTPAADDARSSSIPSRRTDRLLEMTGGLQGQAALHDRECAAAQRHRRPGAQVHRGIARTGSQAASAGYRRHDVGLHGRFPARTSRAS